MRQAGEARDLDIRAEALAWLAEELRWEQRLDCLRRPGRQPRAPEKRPRPATALRRAS